MTTALYMGSFNPLHIGHIDIINKASKIFDSVYVVRGINPDKNTYEDNNNWDKPLLAWAEKHNRHIIPVSYNGLLIDAVKGYNADVVVRGLRNGYDLDYEMNQQYWNEDLGLTIPIIYFICDRKYIHISSSSIRSANKFGVDTSKYENRI